MARQCLGMPVVHYDVATLGAGNYELLRDVLWHYANGMYASVTVPDPLLRNRRVAIGILYPHGVYYPENEAAP
jgi:hypothetical protein